ncbi:protein translocase subunit SecD [Arcanobacterium hippocoleae]|uniref:protein translocase subunit SecD n=1 Tax=Arcanobacterium hippocoleae TaxID=149017 RepID=UPI003342D6E0
MILTPVTTDGSEITQEDVNQAIEIIRQRVDASGVAEAEITAQGGSNIVVGLPGEPSKETLDLVRTSAVLRLRTVIGALAPNALDSAAIAAMKAQAAGQAAPEAKDAPKLSDAQIDAELMKLADKDGDGKLSDQPATKPADSSDEAWITEQMLYDAYKLQCGTQDAQLKGTADNPDTGVVACDTTGQVKYLLGPAEIQGTNLTQASSNLAVDQQGNPSGGWAVSMSFDQAGADKFGEITGRIYNLPAPKNQFAIVLDGRVISAPVPHGAIVGGQAQITGNFTADEAATLANQLSFGSLPLNFEVQSEEQISATLGISQLEAGLIAGLIGLLLIVAYMVWQYHALGWIAVLSILLSTGLSYFVICLLSWTMGYRLSMAGVLGMIISVGVTADSFIVYFERIRDEIRDGRAIRGAITHGWQRAKRTIIISDCVNLLASIVLYILTVGSVRGFAFTLGITTVLDLIVVMMFTYPLMELLGRSKFFGHGMPYSGLNEAKLRKTPRYRGRGSKSLQHDVHPNENVVVDPKVPEDSESSVLEANASSSNTTFSLAQQRAAERRAKKNLAATEIVEGSDE